MSNLQYQMVIRPLSKEEGGGYLVEFPELPGCIADGRTVEEAIREAKDALQAWLITAEEFGDDIPEPNSISKYSGQWRIRVPKSLHATLASRARLEGVSLNMLATTLLAQACGSQSRTLRRSPKAVSFKAMRRDDSSNATKRGA